MSKLNTPAKNTALMAAKSHKRHIVVDILGNLLYVKVHAANNRATSLKISVAKYKNLELSPEGLINEIGRNGFFRCIWSIG